MASSPLQPLPLARRIPRGPRGLLGPPLAPMACCRASRRCVAAGAGASCGGEPQRPLARRNLLPFSRAALRLRAGNGRRTRRTHRRQPFAHGDPRRRTPRTVSAHPPAGPPLRNTWLAGAPGADQLHRKRPQPNLVRRRATSTSASAKLNPIITRPTTSTQARKWNMQLSRRRARRYVTHQIGDSILESGSRFPFLAPRAPLASDTRGASIWDQRFGFLETPR